MPMVEVDEVELNNARLAYQLLKKMETSSPKVRRELFKLVKEVNPEAVLPPDELEPLESKVGEVKSEMSGELEKLRGELQEFKSATRSKEEIAGARARLKAEGWDSEGIAKIEKAMTDKGIADYDVAASYVEKHLMPSAEPTGRGGYNYEPSWDMSTPDESDEVSKQLLSKNWKKATTLAVNQWMADKKAGKVRDVA